MEPERYSFVLLRRGPRADEFADEELEHLQEAHLAHLAAMHERWTRKGTFTFSKP